MLTLVMGQKKEVLSELIVSWLMFQMNLVLIFCYIYISVCLNDVRLAYGIVQSCFELVHK